jgi:DNA-binding SARP family transcriptional activator/tetratricopeptide (TPR) repeat protein
MRSTLAAPVRIRLCGHLVVERDGHELAERALGSRKGRMLLQLLAVERGRLVSAERIADVLWGDDQPRAAAANVATLVSRLRSVLGDGVIAGSRQAYGLLPGGSWETDVDVARQLVTEATGRHKAGEAGLALVASTRAQEILGRHDGLDELPAEDWVTTLRDEIRAMRRTARHLTAVSAIRTGELSTAREVAESAVAADPLDEQAYRDLMTALAADGQSATALSVYADLQRTLRHELGIDPHRDSREVHLTILRGGLPAQRAEVPGTEDRRRADGRLLGRADELAEISGAWTAAVSGEPSLVLVMGEAGIGKSRLLTEVRSSAGSTGGLVLAARCHASERSLFLQPVVEALRSGLMGLSPAALVDLAGAHADALVSLIPALSAAIPTAQQRGARPRAAEAERRLAYEAVAHVLTWLSRDRPVLLVLDDAQDAGLATVDLLDYLARHLGGARVLLVVAARSEEGRALLDRTGDGRTIVALGPLPVSAVTAMAAAAGHADQASALAGRTRGHPFSVVEMLRALAAGESGIPPSLAEAVLGRVSRAGPDAEATMHAAAVLGPQVDPAQLAGLLGLSELDAVHRCEGLVAKRLMSRRDLGYEFANDLVQEVVYDALPAPSRIAYHRAAADLLAAHPEAMARHAEAIGDWPRASRAWLLAGEEAMRRCAAGDAVELVAQAAAAADRAAAPELRSRALLVRASAHEAQMDYRSALADLDDSLAVARRTGDRRLEMAALRARGGDVPVALHHPATDWGAYIETGLEIATELGDRKAVADFSGRLAVLHSSRLRFDEALRYAERAVAAGRASRDDRALAVGLDGLKAVHSYLGDVEPLRVVLDELDPLLRRIDDMWLLQWCVFESSYLAFADGDVETARQRIDSSIEVNARSGYPAYASYFLAHRGWLARLAGDLDAALADGSRATEQAGTVEHPWWLAAASGLQAATLLAAGRPDEAAAVADRGWQSVRGHAAEAYVLLSLAPLAEATGDGSLLAEAAGMLSAVVAPPGRAWVLGADAYLCVARAHHGRGETEQARAAVAPLLRATSPQHWPAVHAAAASVV